MKQGRRRQRYTVSALKILAWTALFLSLAATVVLIFFTVSTLGPGTPAGPTAVLLGLISAFGAFLLGIMWFATLYAAAEVLKTLLRLEDRLSRRD